MPEHVSKERKPASTPTRSTPSSSLAAPLSQDYILQLQRALGNRRTRDLINRAKSPQKVGMLDRAIAKAPGAELSSPLKISKVNQRSLQRLVIPYNSPNGPSTLDTTDEAMAVAKIQQLVAAKNFAEIQIIRAALNQHINNPAAAVTPQERQLRAWLFAMTSIHDQITPHQNTVDQLKPNTEPTPANEFFKRLFLGSAALATSQIFTELPNMVTWFSTVPYTLVATGSFTFDSGATNQSFYMQGQPFQFNLTDPVNNRTFQASGFLPPQTGHMLQDPSSSNMTQTPSDMPLHAQHMISIGFVARTAGSIGMLGGAFGYWWTKPKESDIKAIADAEKEITRLWALIDGLAIKGPF